MDPYERRHDPYNLYKTYYIAERKREWEADSFKHRYPDRHINYIDYRHDHRVMHPNYNEHLYHKNEYYDYPHGVARRHPRKNHY